MKWIEELIRSGALGNSSEADTPRVVKAKSGEIKRWPLLRDTLTVTPMEPRMLTANAVAAMKALGYLDGDAEPETDANGSGAPGGGAPAAVEQGRAVTTSGMKGIEDMDEKELEAKIAAGVAAAFKAQADAAAVEAERVAKEQARIDEALKAAQAKHEAELKAVKDKYIAAGRLPLGEAPYQAQFAGTNKYDTLDAGDQALLVQVLGSKLNGIPRQAPEMAVKALVFKLAEDKSRVGEVGRNAMKAAGINFDAMKADEVMQQDLTGFGDEWVGVAYGQTVWDKIRADSFVAANLPSIEVPAGFESIFLPLEGADPTFYKVAETTDHNATTLFPNATVTSSQMATDRAQLTLAKMGARVPWSGELEEDSLIPFVRQLREQITKAGAEQLDHAIIDGDTEAGATTNINDIGGTPAATDLYMLFNGFRKSPLVTTTANSRSASGSFVVTDYLNTVKMMGTAGLIGADRTKVAFIQDPNVHWKSLELPEVKSKDAFSQPTIEGGMLTSIWGYRVYTSYFMHFVSTTNARKANTAGKVDVTTQANNTTGAILAVRWDQWKLGYRRRMTIETTRYPRSDSSEITALMRLGLKQRDTEASAITYNVGV